MKYKEVNNVSFYVPKHLGYNVKHEIEAFKRNLKTHLFVKFVNESTLAIWFWRIIVKRPRMLSAQLVALYKPCKPKPKPFNKTDVGMPTNPRPP